MKPKFAYTTLFILALTTNQVQAQTLKGAGAASTYPLLSKWFDEYKKQSGVRVDYSAIGIGGGLRQLRENKADFAVTASQLEKSDSFPFQIQQVPIADENIAIIYNLAGKRQPLKISRPILDAILSGGITHWNDQRLQKINVGNTLPDKPIVVIQRSTRSGVNWAMSRYLNKSNRKWKVTASSQWELGIRGNSCDGISAMVKAGPNSIGFVELAYAKQNRLHCAEIENGDKFYPPTSSNYPIWTRHFLIWKAKSPQAAEVARFSRWVSNDGQKFNNDVFFKPVAPELRQKSLAALD